MKKSLVLFSAMLFVLLLGGAGCLSISTGGSKVKTSGPAGMFVSVNQGDTWKQIASWPTTEGVKNISNVSVYKLIEDPSDTKAMYLATRANGLFYTYDDGKTWQHAEGALSTGFIYDVTIHPTNKCTIYASTGSRIYRTDDCSRNWTEVYRESRSGIRTVSLAFSQTSPYKIFAAESNGDVLQSFDSSNSWSILNRFKTNITDIITHPKNTRLMYIITRTNGIYRSYDAGSTWVNLKDKMSDFSGSSTYRRHFIDPDDANRIYWVSTYGILVSETAGDSWSAYDLITPPGSADIYGFAIDTKDHNNIYYTATIGSRSTFYRSIDGGINWETKKLPTAQIPALLRVHPDHPEWVYAGFTVPTS